MLLILVLFAKTSDLMVNLSLSFEFYILGGIFFN